MARIIDLKDKSSLSEAARVLKEGKILVFPSDTVYGIGCVLEKPAIRKLYKIKNRPLRQPTGILLTKRIYDSIRSSAQSSINIINLSEDVKKGFLAGKITLILPKEIFKLDLPSLNKKKGRGGFPPAESPMAYKINRKFRSDSCFVGQSKGKAGAS